jgi:hypothetical protein
MELLSIKLKLQAKRTGTHAGEGKLISLPLCACVEGVKHTATQEEKAKKKKRV